MQTPLSASPMVAYEPSSLSIPKEHAVGDKVTKWVSTETKGVRSQAIETSFKFVTMTSRPLAPKLSKGSLMATMNKE